MNFSGKVILITGAGSGIGAGAASHLASSGASVSIVDRNESRIFKIAKEIKNSGSVIPLPIVADVTKHAQRIVDETINHFGKLDILINCAGFPINDNVIEVNLNDFDRVFDVNVRAVINLTKLCVPHLEKTKGNVVNVSSSCGLKQHSNLMSYCMSKAALNQFTKCSALDLAPKGIRVNAILPAAIRTNIFEAYEMEEQEYEQSLKYRETKYPIGRVGEVSDTNAAIAYLASDSLASFLTGTLLTIDGGSLLV